jgi:hypothetical protein
MTCMRLSAGARVQHRSTAAEVLVLIEEIVPTEQELKVRHNLPQVGHFHLPKKCCARIAHGDPGEVAGSR